jgi:hypothetical protein
MSDTGARRVMWARFWTALWFFIVLLPVGGGHVAAQTYKSEVTKTTATSRCIGQSRTPVCALETYLACFVRGFTEACKRVGLDGIRDGAEDVTSIQYTVLSQKKWKDVPEHPQFNDPRTYHGIQLDLNWRWCYAPPKQRCEREEDIKYWLFRGDHGWEVMFMLEPELATDDPSKPAPPFKHEMSAARTTSRCIGNIRDPICALDTFFACKIRDLGEICSKVAGKGKQDAERPTFIRYTVARWENGLDTTDRPGYNLPPATRAIRLSVRHVECFGPPHRWCMPPLTYAFYVTPVKGGWYVVTGHD